ncbi:MAG TPA: bifunctional UDP-sugar hydrolase/5'-nucleotidase [Bacteroidota bacterium]|nr:bifunctional UDP-sugar hydrolase/5'-nucleotidase [Bacteroidota bacterium]
MRLFSARVLGRLCAACLIACAAAAQVRTLTILHTNDMHAAFLPREAVWIRATPRPMVGGFAELARVIDSVRATRRAAGVATLLLDAGDVMTGNPITEREYAGAQGGALFAMMNMMDYDAWCPGNHDFDVSQANLRALGRIAHFPMVCANVVDTLGRYPVGNVPYVILRRGGLRVGVIGLMSQDLYNLVNQNNLVGIRVLSPVETALRFIDSLRNRVDITIALTHEGVEDDSALAAGAPALALIVGGHSHTRLRHPRVVAGVPIVQTGSSAENLGVVDLTLEGTTVTACQGSLIQLWAGGAPVASPVAALADSMKREIDRDYDAVIATLRGNWTRSESQNALGTFLADAQREAAHAEVGFMNNGGIRRDVAAGPLTKKTLFEILPFRNILATFQLTGAQLRTVLTNDVEARPGIQVAGISGVWRRGEGGRVEFTSITVGGKPLDENRMYRCAASDFFVGEAKRYLGLEIAQPYYLRQTVFDAVEAIVRARGEIVPRITDTIEQSH